MNGKRGFFSPSSFFSMVFYRLPPPPLSAQAAEAKFHFSAPVFPIKARGKSLFFCVFSRCISRIVTRINSTRRNYRETRYKYRKTKKSLARRHCVAQKLGMLGMSSHRDAKTNFEMWAISASVNICHQRKWEKPSPLPTHGQFFPIPSDTKMLPRPPSFSYQRFTN